MTLVQSQESQAWPGGVFLDTASRSRVKEKFPSNTGVSWQVSMPVHNDLSLRKNAHHPADINLFLNSIDEVVRLVDQIILQAAVSMDKANTNTLKTQALFPRQF